MAAVTFEAAEVREYRNGVLQSSENIRMGTQLYGSSTTWYHDVVIVLDLPRSLKKLTVLQKWASHQSGTSNYSYSAALTQEERTSAPEAAELTFKFPSKEAEITFERKLKKGRWYLWLWRHSRSAPSFMYGTRGTHPILTLSGESAGAGRVYRNGIWLEASPMAYREGTWQETGAKNYRGEWGELT